MGCGIGSSAWTGEPNCPAGPPCCPYSLRDDWGWFLPLPLPFPLGLVCQHVVLPCPALPHVAQTWSYLQSAPRLHVPRLNLLHLVLLSLVLPLLVPLGRLGLFGVVLRGRSRVGLGVVGVRSAPSACLLL